MNTQSISNKAYIAILRTKAFTANRQHQAETGEENARHGIANVARVYVTLTEHPALISCRKNFAKARQELYRLTLPSSDEGYRLLPHGRELELSSKLQRHKDLHDKSTAEFLQAYPAEVAGAAVRMGPLFDPRFFPPVHELQDRFVFSWEYRACPHDATWSQWLQESAQEAENDLRERLRTALQNIHSKLSSPDAIFRDSLIANLADVAGLAKDLNMTEAQDIANASQAAFSDLAGCSPDVLRENATERQKAAARANAICSMLK